MKRFVAFFDQQEPATPLAIVRILLGVCVLVTIGQVIAAGLVDAMWVDKDYGGLRNLQGNWFVQALGGPTPQVVWRLVFVSLIGGVAMVVGLGGRVAASLLRPQS